MPRESLIISVEGPVSTARVLNLLSGCHCPPRRRLSITLSQIPQGASITMSTGNPVVLALAVDQKALGTLTYNDSPDVPSGITAVSDNAAIVVTQNDDTSFFVGGDGSTEATGNVTFSDSDGNTIVVTVITTVAPPPHVKTLGVTFDAPVSI